MTRKEGPVFVWNVASVDVENFSRKKSVFGEISFWRNQFLEKSVFGEISFDMGNHQ